MENVLKKISEKNLYMIIGAIAIMLIIIITTCIIISITNKPNKDKAKKVVDEYIVAMSTGDSTKMLEVIEPESYIIFKEGKEKDFDANYKKKSDFINDYLTKNNISNMDLATQKISSEFENVYGYYEYTINEITSIENSEKSKNIIIVRCKVQLKSNRYSTVNSARFYILKNNGDYKIVGMEM